MKKVVVSIVVILIVVVLAAFNYRNSSNETGLNIGDKVPNLAQKLSTLNGKDKMLREFNKPNGLLVVFTCNTCPFVVAWEDRYNQIADLCEQNNIGMVLVNSNEALRGKEDSPEEMKKHAAELNYKAPYVIDNKHVMADAFGAKTTPHIYLFNSQMELFYKGAIDDNYKNAKSVKSNYLKDAITAMTGGEELETRETKAVGCSIKRLKS
jgi:hypothetical protein